MIVSAMDKKMEKESHRERRWNFQWSLGESLFLLSQLCCSDQSRMHFIGTGERAERPVKKLL